MLASPTPAPNPKQTSTKSEVNQQVQPTSNAIVQSANGWAYDKGEWTHPDGYKYVKGRILRTTAHAGGSYPTAPGKLALQNPEKLSPAALAATGNANKAAVDKTATTKAAEKARNLAPRPGHQTGTHL